LPYKDFLPRQAKTVNELNDKLTRVLSREPSKVSSEHRTMLTITDGAKK